MSLISSASAPAPPVGVEADGAGAAGVAPAGPGPAGVAPAGAGPGAGRPTHAEPAAPASAGPLEGLTVHQVLQRFPATAPVFDRLGIHTCCGGEVTLDVAARRDGVPADRLAHELGAALREAR